MSATAEHIINDLLSERFPDADTMKDIGLKLGEEAGEVQGAIVKMPEGRATEDDLKDEIGDVLICLSRLAAKLDMSLEELRDRRWGVIANRGREEQTTTTDAEQSEDEFCITRRELMIGLHSNDEHIMGSREFGYTNLVGNWHYAHGAACRQVRDCFPDNVENTENSE